MRTLLIILLFLPSVSNATNYYFSSSTGADGNPGTQAQPMQTMSKIGTLTLAGGDSVFLKRGDTWHEQMKLTKNASSGSHIYVGAYGTGAQPLITGYVQLSTWVSIGGNIYSAAVAGIKYTARNFLLDGSQRALARFPNTGYATYTSSTSNSITDPTLTGTPNYTGSRIIVRSSHFTLDTSTVSSQSPATVLNLASNLSYTGAGGNGYIFYGQDQWLDTFGEWCVNTTLDSIHVYFGAGGPTGHTAYISNIDTNCIATGSWYDVEDIHYQGANWYAVHNPFGNGHFKFNRCLLDYGYNGMYLFAVSDTVRNSTIQYMLNNGIAATTNGLSKYMNIINDTIKYCGYIVGMGNSGNLGNYYGIINNADSCVYQNIEMDTIGYQGIRFGGNNTVVKYNHVNYFCTVLDDGAGIYTWEASDVTYSGIRQVIGNYVENGKGNTGGVVNDQAASANGIYFDTHSMNIETDSNTCINNYTAGYFVHGKNIGFKYNVGYGNQYAQFFQTEFSGQPITGNVIKYNTLVSPDTAVPAIRFMTPGTDIATMSTTDSNYYGSTTGAVNQFWTKSSGDPGTFRSFSNWKSYLSCDAQATYQTGVLTYTGNTTFSYVNRYLTGRYKGFSGRSYLQLIPLLSTSGIPLLVLDIGYLSTFYGVKIIAN